MRKRKKGQRPTTPSKPARAPVSGVPLMLAMVGLTLAGLLHTVYVMVTRTATGKVSSDPVIVAILLVWIGLLGLTWHVVAVLRWRDPRGRRRRLTKAVLLLGALGYAGAAVCALLVSPFWIAWVVAQGASVLTGASVTRMKNRSPVTGLLLGLVLGMVGVLIAAMLRARPEQGR